MKITDYTNIAERYDKNQFRTDEIRLDNELEEYIESNRKPEYQVLDLSCGTGLYLEKQINAFSGLNISWHGLDLSDQMLNKAREKVIYATFVKANAENMPYPSETFDFISNNYAFHHYSNKGQALSEIYRILMKGGIYKLHNIAVHDMPDWWVYHYFPSAFREDEKRFWNKGKIFNELTESGFKVNLRIEYRRENIRVNDYLFHAENRDISVLTLINDSEYYEGLERMRNDVKINPDINIVNDFAELFCTAEKF
ncbi:methyltransferase domain-containing protein [Bacillus infantis]|uniref:Methyltransferase domain-containing protein n=1 Tax=Bacillus infantis TaxID=324767 RepID=A0A5D4SPV3_9BACI|nr:methyltransferase domain-containing protein [Bacillus infantis]TYS64218.1 methyltransferase domain-containing protein [Bacillus infantis]